MAICPINAGGQTHEKGNECRIRAICVVRGFRWKGSRGCKLSVVHYGRYRGLDCVFSSREQCMQDGRNRGFGGQCIQNPGYKPGQPSIVSGPVAKRAVSQGALRSLRLGAAATCTQLKSACLSGSGSASGCTSGWGNRFNLTERYCDDLCNDSWERCMKSGFWEGHGLHRPAERR